MIENTERLLRAKRAQKNKRLLYSLGGFLLFFSFFLVYIVPGILRRTNLDKYFLQISENYNISFSYTHNALVYAVVKIYFIFVYPFLLFLTVLVFLFVIYRVNNRIPSFCIFKYKEDLWNFFILVISFFILIFVFYFIEASESSLWPYQVYFSNRILFSWFVFMVQLTGIGAFLGLLVVLIDSLWYLYQEIKL